MKYSIITVNFNNREGLRKTIESVINQSYKNFEFIIIDGGSTDGSRDVIQQYAYRINYWVSEPDKGIYNAMNKGIAKATGDYLNFMNSGDCFYDNEVLKNVERYGYDTDIITGRDYHYSEKKKMGHASIQPPRLSMITFFIATLDHQSSFIKRELFHNSPYCEDYHLVSDWIFFTEKIVSEKKSVQFIPNIICRREEGGISEQQSKLNRKEICQWLHHYLPQGVYDDYSTLAKIDKTNLYRLFILCDHSFARRLLIYCIKVIYFFL